MFTVIVATSYKTRFEQFEEGVIMLSFQVVPGRTVHRCYIDRSFLSLHLDDGGLHFRFGIVELLSLLYCCADKDRRCPVRSVIWVIRMTKTIPSDGEIRLCREMSFADQEDVDLVVRQEELDFVLVILETISVPMCYAEDFIQLRHGYLSAW